MYRSLQSPLDSYRPLPPLEAIQANLPLQNASHVYQPLTGASEFRAPPGYAFAMTGHFIVTTDQNNIETWDRPQESRALLQSLCEKERLDDTWFDDAEEASEKYLADAPTSFTGQHLKINFETRDYVNTDVTFKGQLSDNEKLRTRISVYGQVDAWYEAGLQDYSYPVNAAGLTYDVDFIEVSLARLQWQRWLSEGNLLTSCIALIPFTPPTPTLQAVRLTDREKALQLVRSGQHNHIAALRDGPLKDLKIILGEVEDLESEVRTAVSQCGKPLGYAETEKARSAAQMAKLRERAAQRIQSQLKLVTADFTSLDRAVAEYCSPDWVEREISLLDDR